MSFVWVLCHNFFNFKSLPLMHFQVAELEDGTLYMNSRTLNPLHPRAHCYSFDGGRTLSAIQLDMTLIEPGFKRRNGAWVPSSTGGCAVSILVCYVHIITTLFLFISCFIAGAVKQLLFSLNFFYYFFNLYFSAYCKSLK